MGKQEKKAPAAPNRRPNNTAGNKLVRIQRDGRLKQADGPKVERGTARRLRREAWAGIRKKVSIEVPGSQVDPVESKKQDKVVFKKVMLLKEVWQPSFAEWSKIQRGGK